MDTVRSMDLLAIFQQLEVENTINAGKKAIAFGFPVQVPWICVLVVASVPPFFLSQIALPVWCLLEARGKEACWWVGRLGVDHWGLYIQSVPLRRVSAPLSRRWPGAMQQFFWCRTSFSNKTTCLFTRHLWFLGPQRCRKCPRSIEPVIVFFVPMWSNVLAQAGALGCEHKLGVDAKNSSV